MVFIIQPKFLLPIKHFIEMLDILYRLFVVCATSYQIFLFIPLFRDSVRAVCYYGRVFFHNIDVVNAGFALLCVSDIFEIAARVFLAVHIVRLVPCRR